MHGNYSDLLKDSAIESFLYSNNKTNISAVINLFHCPMTETCSSVCLSSAWITDSSSAFAICTN